MVGRFDTKSDKCAGISYYMAMEQKKNTFDTYDPYDPDRFQLPAPIAERLVTEVQEGYVKVSTEAEDILRPVTAERNRLDFLIDQYGSTVVLLQVQGGFEVYVPEIFAKGKTRDDN